MAPKLSISNAHRLSHHAVVEHLVQMGLETEGDADDCRYRLVCFSKGRRPAPVPQPPEPVPQPPTPVPEAQAQGPGPEEMSIYLFLRKKNRHLKRVSG